MDNPDADPVYVTGFNDGFRRALRELRDGLDSMADEDGSLSGGDCVDYVYLTFNRMGIEPLDEPKIIEIERPSGLSVSQNALLGTRDELLLLARTIHDTLEGADQ